MNAAANSVPDLFRELGTPDELSARGRRASDDAPPLKVNAHIHLPPNFSAFDTVAQAVDLAAAEGVGVLGASNYYDYGVYTEFAALAARRGILPLFGIEIITLIDELVRDGIKVNDPGNPGKMYLCGKGIAKFDPMSPEAARLLAEIREKDSQRMARVTERLADLFAAAGIATGLTEEAVKDQVVRRHGSARASVYLQERHVAQAFQESLFERVSPDGRAAALARLFGAEPRDAADAPAVQNEIRSHLMKAGKPAYVQETFVGFDHAYRLILALGGIPCYPTVADGASPLCAFEMPVADLIGRIRERNLHCAELIPIRNSPEVLAEYVRAMRAAGLVVTAGTEHNTRDMLPIEPRCVGGAAVAADVQAIFREGACVVAAHQYLCYRGETGFVTAEGAPNPQYADAEARISAFRQLGAGVIDAFQDRHRRPATA